MDRNNNSNNNIKLQIKSFLKKISLQLYFKILINLKKIETDFYCDFGKLVDLTGFQSSILLFVTIDKMCWRHEALI